MKKFPSLIILTILLFVSAFGQGSLNPGSRKIAFVNESALDSKEGITKLNKAWTQVEMSCCFPACNKSIYEKRRQLFVNPVLSEIADFIKLFELKTKIIVLESFKLESEGALLFLDTKLDITKYFIKQFNEKDGALESGLKTLLPAVRLGAIDTRRFYHNATGIDGLRGTLNCTEDSIITPCPSPVLYKKVGNAIQNYAIESGYGIVLDSSKPIPTKLIGLDSDDITDEFIVDFERKSK